MVGSESLNIAFEALVLNKLRSGLTMLGIVIGVFAVVAMVGLGQGSQAFVTSQIEGLGSRVVSVTPGNPKAQSGGGPPGFGVTAKLSLADVEAMRTLPGVERVSGSVFRTIIVQVGREKVGATVLGTDPDVVQVRGLKLAQGRFFTEQEARTGARVVVLGQKVAESLFAKSLKNPLEGRLRIGQQRFRVIGILALQGGGLFGSVDDQVFTSVRAYQAAVDPRDSLNSVFVSLATQGSLEAGQSRLQDLLRRRHSLRADEDDDFKVQSQADLLKTVSMVTGAFTVLLGGIAAISLLVGGIGVMNIMLVSVTERTREIGIRKAIGAKTGAIMRQFLIEAATLSLVGGTLGILLGLAVVYAVSRFANFPFVFSPLSVGGAFVFSALIGIFFGLYPAAKAARLDPVEALRYE